MGAELIELLLSVFTHLSKQIYKRYIKKRKAESGKESTLGEDISNEERIRIVDDVIGGVLGEKLVDAYRDILSKGDYTHLEELKKYKKRTLMFVVEISRNIMDDILLRFKKQPEYIFSMVKQLEAEEFPEIAISIYNVLRLVNALHNGPRIDLYLSTPSVLALQLGQLLGIDKFKITLNHYSTGKYVRVPALTRKKLDTPLKL